MSLCVTLHRQRPGRKLHRKWADNMRACGPESERSELT